MIELVHFIPSPSQGVWHLGPIPLRAYAFGIIIGAIVAIWIGEKRWVARGGTAGFVADAALWAIPFGIVGARLYHVITDAELYFAAGRDPWRAFLIWEGGLGIWGGVAGGALGAWIYCRRSGASALRLADSVAPGLLVAQAIGRLGNYFNQELFGRPTTVPWALEISPIHRPDGYAQFATFHPTFLYELLWNLAAAAVLVLLDRRFRFTHGRAFALYVMLYTLGRGWIEMLRIDTANHIGPFRLNVWTAMILFVAALVYFLRARGRVDGPANADDLADAPPADLPAERGDDGDGSAAASDGAASRASVADPAAPPVDDDGDDRR